MQQCSVSVECRPAFLGDTRVVQVPSVVHHQLEVGIIINRHRNRVVVFDPLVWGYAAILWVILMDPMMHIKSVEELNQNLVFSFLACDDIWVLLSVVDAFDVRDVEHTGAVFIHDLKGSHAEILSKLVHLTADPVQELVIINLTIAVLIKNIAESHHLFLVKVHSLIMKCFYHLLLVQGVITIVVSNLKCAS